MRKKSPFTLIEVIVAAFLCSLIFTILVQGYIFTQRQRIETHAFHEQAALSQRIYFRLAPIFSKLAKLEKPQNKQLSSKILSLTKLPHAQGLGLECTFDNGIDPHQAFCNILTCALYLDGRQRLCLKMINDDNDVREEILCEGIQTLSFSFFNPNAKKWEEKCLIKELEEAPKMIKVQITLKENRTSPLEWVFFTHLRNEPIDQ